jgi:hypothetical protein
MSLPTQPASWTAECRQCDNLSIVGGRFWKCKVVLVGQGIVSAGTRAYCADARAEGGKCGPGARLFEAADGVLGTDKGKRDAA